MKNRSFKMSIIALMAIATGNVYADGQYNISVTNLTRSQIIGPPFAATHNNNIKLFTLGAPASSGLALLAQDGKSTILNPLASASPDVNDVLYTGAMATKPGATSIFMLSATNAKNYLTVAAMLATTNDTFMALNGVALPLDNQPVTYNALAYDAGAEDNDENCMYIPGPPCGNPMKASNVPGEGYVYVSSGIHGIGSLPLTLDWRNPVAAITIVKVN